VERGHLHSDALLIEARVEPTSDAAMLAVAKGRRRRRNAFLGCCSKVGVQGMVLSIGKFLRFANFW